jgi:uncharacterized membrane protein
MIFFGLGINGIKEKEMDKKFGYYIFGGMLIGAMLGLTWSMSGNVLVGLVLGAFVGTAIGWFLAAAQLENQNQKKKNK